MIQSIKENALEGHIPVHIAIIMDGNGRWAKERSLPRVAGHKEGVNSVREITRACGEIGVKHLTLYTFSTENWRRPKAEVSALMTLLLKTISVEVRELHKNNVRFTAIGDLKKLPRFTQKRIFDGIEITKNNTGLNLCLALNYGSRQEMVAAVQAIAKKVQKENNIKLDYLVGTMIELPRAVMRANDIAKHADFFSFGTNDLTQTTFGISRDDSGKFLNDYIENKIFDIDPFVSIDDGVGYLIEIATIRGRKQNKKLKLGICGEHGGDPKSIHFCSKIGLDYVSCSPYRVPVARLAAAQAQLKK